MLHGDLDEIARLSYVDFMAFLGETNRPPGGLQALHRLLLECRVSSEHVVLDIGCNTGYTTMEAVRLTGCRAVGIDISSTMIERARNSVAQDVAVRDHVSFEVADATNLPFRAQSFDRVFSGGSTAFIDDIASALREYTRVLKSWGFLGEINFYYRSRPPLDLIRRLNEAMGTNIKPWDRRTWLSYYERAGLDLVHCSEHDVDTVSDARVDEYVSALLGEQTQRIREGAAARLRNLMQLFNENHRYLCYGIFVLRRRELPQSPWLFYP